MWVAIREATAEETQKLEKRAERFARYHHFGLWYGKSRLDAVQTHIDWLAAGNASQRRYASYYKQLWRRIVRRTLGKLS